MKRLFSSRRHNAVESPVLDEGNENSNETSTQTVLEHALREYFNTALVQSNPTSLFERKIEIPSTSWEDIFGLENVKLQLKELLRFPVEYSDAFAKFGMSPSRGFLFYGPSGCGKKLLARAVANECQASFISIKCSELILNKPEQNVRDIFDEARSAEPCVLFFDEFDFAYVPMRNETGDVNADYAGYRFMNQLLTEMDGVGGNRSVFFIGATNRPKIVDSVFMNPGRLDQLIYIPLPNFSTRLAVLKGTLRKSHLSKNVDLHHLARTTEKYSISDLLEVCQKGAKLAIRENMQRLIENMRAGESDDEIHFDFIPEIAVVHFEEAVRMSHPSVSHEENIRNEKYFKSFKGFNHLFSTLDIGTPLVFSQQEAAEEDEDYEDLYS